MILEGIVTTGYGKASEIMSLEEVVKWYQQVLHPDVVPGTVNVKLETQFVMPKKGVVCATSPLSGQKFYYLPIKLFGKTAWIMRPERHPFNNNIIEVIATEYILNTYNLRIGDPIHLIIEKDSNS